ncbi:pseudouridine synthase [Arenibacterium halophilum]|uniref:Pseudouridine synthase n=1 Tax=Arenibacterium halophilum TaxID=2583821 RepID=A0ABY2XFI5_9RHOB|nr:pseudouridine synthase [Arenibacterium halophilum]TMV15238.1 pseudouridine synthase [Arenibacterium halophilum]
MNSTTPPSDGERIAKVLARRGVASRRDAERMILAGRVQVDGKRVDTPAVNIAPDARITVDGTPVRAAEPTRLWLYHKAPGLVTTERDEQGRDTVFDALRADLPRVMSVGRLDLNSEGLLLLTNDGELKRRLELPATGWLRRYRVRINGRPQDSAFDPLREGIEVDGEQFLPMQITLDRQKGANAWLTIGLREGRNREIRRAMEDIGFTVNRLIRLSYGPFQLGQLKAGEVLEIKRRVLRDQLGDELSEGLDLSGEGTGEGGGKRDKPTRRPDPRGDRGPRKDFGGKPGYKRDDRDGDARPDRGPRKDFGKGPRKDFGGKPGYKRDDRDGDARPDRGPRKEFGNKGPRKDFGGKPGFKRDDRDGDARPDRGPRKDFGKGPRKDFGGKPHGKPGDTGGGKPAHRGKPSGSRPQQRGKPGGQNTGRDGGKRH